MRTLERPNEPRPFLTDEEAASSTPDEARALYEALDAILREMRAEMESLGGAPRHAPRFYPGERVFIIAPGRLRLLASNRVYGDFPDFDVADRDIVWRVISRRWNQIQQAYTYDIRVDAERTPWRGGPEAAMGRSGYDTTVEHNILERDIEIGHTLGDTASDTAGAAPAPDAPTATPDGEGVTR